MGYGLFWVLKESSGERSWFDCLSLWWWVDLWGTYLNLTTRLPMLFHTKLHVHVAKLMRMSKGSFQNTTEIEQVSIYVVISYVAIGVSCAGGLLVLLFFIPFQTVTGRPFFDVFGDLYFLTSFDSKNFIVIIKRYETDERNRKFNYSLDEISSLIPSAVLLML